MSESLDTFTNEELGKLFPIVLTNHDPNWINLFIREKEKIETTFTESAILEIHHIGSTAIPKIKSKPTIDILLVVSEAIDKAEVIEKLSQIGYHFISRPESPPPHMMFVKGYTLSGIKDQSYHIHIRHKVDCDELYFRDYLLSNPKVAEEYSNLKEDLALKFKNDREAYTFAKSDFIKRINSLARNNIGAL